MLKLSTDLQIVDRDNLTTRRRAASLTEMIARGTATSFFLRGRQAKPAMKFQIEEEEEEEKKKKKKKRRRMWDRGSEPRAVWGIG